MSEEKKGFFRRLREGLTKTRDNIVAGIDSIFSGFSSIDDDFYEEIEEILVMGDIGINTTTSIIEHLKEEVAEKKIKEPSECKQLLIDEIKRQMDVGDTAYEFENRKSVVLVIGVNGVGKTTSVGKLAGKLKDQGKKVIVPGDGTSLWTLTHSNDFAKGFCGLMGNPHAIGNAYHITSDERMTWDQIVRITAQALGVEARIVHIPTDVLGKLNPEWVGSMAGDKSNSVWFDNTKIRRDAPEFVCTTRFADGVREALHTIYADASLQKLDPAFDDWCDRVIAQYEAAVETLPVFEG